MKRRDDIRNVAIIAHVDHGKTTLVDAMLRQCGQFRASQLQGERILDSNDLERERGITILAKNIAINYGAIKINLIDTPGHADFGGEVERTLQMADGALVLVDAFEGPMPQTKFVLRKAFACHVRPIVVINKIDRPDARPNEVLNEIFDTFVEQGASEDQLDFPYIFASGKAGFASHDPHAHAGDVKPLFDMIVEHVPGPGRRSRQPVSDAVHDARFLGVRRPDRDRPDRGRPRDAPQKAVLIKAGDRLTSGSIDSVLVFDKLGRVETETAEAGDIVAIVGLGSVDIGDTIADPEHPVALPRIEVDQPTLSMLFTVNDSPLDRRGTVPHVAALERAARIASSSPTSPSASSPATIATRSSSRAAGCLHLSVLIETMRREGYELAVGKPEVIFRTIDGQTCEPYEFLVVDVPHAHIGPVIELTGTRRGEMTKMDVKGAYAHLEFMIPARGLIGLRSRLLSATQGEAIMHHNFHDYRPTKGDVPHRANGVMVSMVRGQAVAFALDNLQQRGTMFVQPGDLVYEGMIIGENARDDDMVVNPVQGKEADQHAGLGLRQEHPLEAPARADARAGARIHRGRRAGRGHPLQDPAAQEGLERRRPQTVGARSGQGSV